MQKIDTTRRLYIKRLKEDAILKFRYFGLTLQECADIFNVTKERIRQLEACGNERHRVIAKHLCIDKGTLMRM